MRRQNPKDSEKVARLFWGSLLLITILLIIDIISGVGISSWIFTLLYPNKSITLTEPQVKPKIIIYRKEDVIIPATMNDPFKDLKNLVENPVPEHLRKVIVDSHHLDVEWNPTMRDFLSLPEEEEYNSLIKFQNEISQHEMYPEDDTTVRRLLQRLATGPFYELYEKEGGTQFKMICKYQTGYRALFKPMRFTREQQTAPNHAYYNDYERHNGEIASYHLDKVLGFRRAIPMVGRRINITSEMLPYVNDDLAATFYVSPAGRVCFTGKCDVFCDTSHGICGDPYTIEGSFAAFLPRHKDARRKVWRHPWRRSYAKRRPVEADHNEKFCEKVRKVHPYDEGRRMLDLIDMAVYDFLIGNWDRHHYETFKTFDTNETFTIHLDQGRSFGLPFHDEHSILLPLKQCCEIRRSTVETLLNFHTGPVKLSAALRESLKSDPLPDLLWEPHYESLDRRIPIILEYVRNCVVTADKP